MSCLLGADVKDVQKNNNVSIARAIDDAVQFAIAKAAGKTTSPQTQLSPDELEWVSSEKTRWSVMNLIRYPLT